MKEIVENKISFLLRAGYFSVGCFVKKVFAKNRDVWDFKKKAFLKNRCFGNETLSTGHQKIKLTNITRPNIEYYQAYGVTCRAHAQQRSYRWDVSLYFIQNVMSLPVCGYIYIFASDQTCQLCLAYMQKSEQNFKIGIISVLNHLLKFYLQIQSNIKKIYVLKKVIRFLG